MRILAVAITAAVAGCTTDVPAPRHGKADAIAFFTGRTNGLGELDILFQSPVPVRVASVGRPDGRGGLILDQRISEGDKPVRMRRWRLRPAGPDRLIGSLTDADGPVSVTVRGGRIHIEYEMKNGMDVDQWLTLRGDGRTIDNRMSVRRFGITLATVEETIAKL